MIEVARRAEQETTGSLIATPHAEAMLHASLAVAPDPPPDAGPEIKQRIVRPKKKPGHPLTAAVVMARKPRRW